MSQRAYPAGTLGGNREILNARKLQPNGDPLRIAYNAALEQFKGAPMDTPILPSTLRSDAVLAIQQSVKWTLTENTRNPGMNTVRTTDIRLQQQDAFVIVELCVMFGNELSAGTAPGSVLLQTWENPAAVAVLPLTVGGFGLNAASLIEAYNGRLSMTVDTVVYLNGLDMLHFKRVDTAQAGTLIFTASNQSQSYFAGGPFFPIAPFAVLTGQSTNLFELLMPESTDFTLVASNRVIASLFARGLLVANGASYL